MSSKFQPPSPSKVAAAVASVLALGSASAFAGSIVQGVVGGVNFTPPVFADTAAASSAASTTPTVFSGATVCFDLNNNGACDAGEPYTTTSATGSFKLSSATEAPLVAQIGGAPGTAGRNVFRVHPQQITAATKSPLLVATVNITPLTTEVALAIENQGVSYNTAIANLADRIGVSTAANVVLPPTQVTNSADKAAITQEAVIAQGRLALAAKFVDRGDTIGELRGNFDCPSVVSFDAINADGCSGTDLNSVANIPTAEKYAYNLEGMPQYDYVFVIIEENESQNSVYGASTLPYINSFLKSGNTYYNYFSTGAPSEPNYLALGAADDFGQTGDEAIPYPAIVGVVPNLANSMLAQGLTWHTYEGTLVPSAAGTTANIAGATSWNQPTNGIYFDSAQSPAVTGTDGLAFGTYYSTATKLSTLALVAKKHNPVVWFADAVAQPNYALNARTISGAYGSTDVNGNAIPYSYPSNTNTTTGFNYTSAGNWDNALQAYATANGITAWWNPGSAWTQDQFKADLASGNVANLNFIVPDQLDDMHNSGTVPRTDYWVQNVVTKIKSSALWNDPNKRVAIVLTFDEGESAQTSCCGWNPERTGDGSAQLVTFSANGTKVSSQSAESPFTEAFNGATFTPPAYSNGNHGHGVTTFSLQTNQVVNGAPSGLYDTDYYSHFSFVRTLQDVFGLSDPGLPGTYMNRSKYTESFIHANATVLPEFAGSANPHFDAVRAMNHVYQFPAGVTHVIPAGTVTPPVTTGPDANQTNLWAQ
jgi:hypothetical protein